MPPWRAVLGLLALGLAAPASGFRPYADSHLALSWRWSAEPYRGTGLHDGIQVAVEPDLIAKFGVPPQDRPLFEAAIVAAFQAWASPVLQFQVVFDGPAVRGAEAGQGLEIDLFAVPGDDPLFDGTDFFGIAPHTYDFVNDRLLTSGQRATGNVITGADIFLNIDNILLFRDLLGLTLPQQQQAIQRLLMHEIGHTLGFDHPNQSSETNVDSNADPLDPIPIDPCLFYAGLAHSSAIDPDAVMSNAAPLAALFRTTLTNDEIGGRDALYPDPNGTTCAPFGPSAPPGAVALLGPGGAGPGLELVGPQDVAVDAAGSVYTIAAQAKRLFRVDPDGAVSVVADQADFDPLEPGGFTLSELAVDAAGTAYLGGSLDSGARVTPAGVVSPLSTLDIAYSADLALAPGGSVFVSRTPTAEVHRIAPDGTSAVWWTGGQELRGVDVDTAGRVYVASAGTDQVFLIEPDGSARALIGPQGDGLGNALDWPVALAVDGAGTLWVAGHGSDNLFRILASGAVEHMLSGGWGQLLNSPSKLDTDGMGNAYVVGYDSPHLVRVQPDGTVESILDLRADISGLTPGENYRALAVDAFGNAFVSTYGDTVLRVDAACRPGLDTPPLLSGVSPARAWAGQPLGIQVSGVAPGARLFVGTTSTPLEVWDSQLAIATTPALPPGFYELRVVNSPTCASAAILTLEIYPRPSRRCGLLGAEALLPLVAWALRRRARRAGGDQPQP
jgi:sugar lactone lactonase YvrE